MGNRPNQRDLLTRSPAMELLWKVPLGVVLAVITLALLYSALVVEGGILLLLFLVVLVVALAWAVRDVDWSNLE